MGCITFCQICGDGDVCIITAALNKLDEILVPLHFFFCRKWINAIATGRKLSCSVSFGAATKYFLSVSTQ